MIRMGRLGLVVAALCVSSVAWSASRTPTLPPGMSKVSSVLQTQWQETSRHKRRKTTIECFLRLDGQATPQRLSQLEDEGFVARSVIPTAANRQRAGAILTGSLQLHQLADVARCPLWHRLKGPHDSGASSANRGQSRNDAAGLRL
jgi:hypothetical protein